MANWDTAATQTQFDAGAAARSQIEQRSAAREAAAGKASKSGSYSIVGMNVTKIPGVIDAIEAYIKNINAVIDKINTEADPTKAFRGDEVQSAVKSYIEKVKEECYNLVSDLRAFEDKLVEAQHAWQSSMSSMASNVSSSAGSYATGTMYQRTIQ